MTTFEAEKSKRERKNSRKAHRGTAIIVVWIWCYTSLCLCVDGWMLYSITESQRENLAAEPWFLWLWSKSRSRAPKPIVSCLLFHAYWWRLRLRIRGQHKALELLLHSRRLSHKGTQPLRYELWEVGLRCRWLYTGTAKTWQAAVEISLFKPEALGLVHRRDNLKSLNEMVSVQQNYWQDQTRQEIQKIHGGIQVREKSPKDGKNDFSHVSSIR